MESSKKGLGYQRKPVCDSPQPSLPPEKPLESLKTTKEESNQLEYELWESLVSGYRDCTRQEIAFHEIPIVPQRALFDLGPMKPSRELSNS